jgi:putative transposase
VTLACEIVGMPKPTYYRLRKPKPEPTVIVRSSPPRAFSDAEKKIVLDTMHEERFVERAPREVYAALLDEGRRICSVSSMYRILAANDEVRERRNFVRHPKYEKPQLLATGPNQVWSWDITMLKGPEKWTHYYLYVIIDIFSRYVVGWTVSPRQTAELASELIEETCLRQSIDKDQLIIHSDRGAPMISQKVVHLLAELGVTKSLSRPHVSDDNAYSEAHFKTLKYQPRFPEKFGSIEDAQDFLRWFFSWYNNEHYHSGIALMTPEVVHYGLAENCNRSRQRVLLRAYEERPDRFVRGQPRTLKLPTMAWINPPPPAVANATVSSGTIIGGVR